MRIHREGIRIILFTLVLVAILIGLFWFLFAATLLWLFVILAAGGAFLIYLVIQFFRYPKRVKSWDEEDIISPADGHIVAIETVHEGEYAQEERKVVSIFMSIWNVHANWVPVSGTLEYYKYHPGKYLLAKHPKSSELNERTSVGINSPKWGKVMTRQIAGYVARRIICYATNEGSQVKAGDEMGFIRFGSRVDIFLPVDAELEVGIGDTVRGHRTVICSRRSG